MEQETDGGSGTPEESKDLDEKANLNKKKDKKKKEKEDKAKHEGKDSTKKDKSDSNGRDHEPTSDDRSDAVGKKKDPSEPAPSHNTAEPTHTAQTPPAITTGQWSANMFESSERQNKFLRLLGGFKKAEGDGSAANSAASPGSAADKKKGLFGSLLQPKKQGSHTTGGERALTYQGAQMVNKRLESDFERALTFSVKGQRGGGLGFTPDPAEGKKFHIDIHKTASKKFD